MVLACLSSPAQTAGVHHRQLRRSFSERVKTESTELLHNALSSALLLESHVHDETSPAENTQVSADLHDVDAVDSNDDDDDDDDDNDDDDSDKEPAIQDNKSDITVHPKSWHTRPTSPLYQVKEYRSPEPVPENRTDPREQEEAQKNKEHHDDHEEEAPHKKEKHHKKEEHHKEEEHNKKEERETKPHNADKIEEAKGALDAAKVKMHSENARVEAFEDEKAFHAKIDGEVKAIANETQSPALSSFLGELRQEMRAYAKPSYPTFLEARADKAERRVKELEAELAAEEGQSGATKMPEGQQANKHKRTKIKTKSKKEGEEEEADEEEEQTGTNSEGERQAGETWALSFFANIALLAVIFGMASTKDGLIRNYTWYVIDQVVAIFLAVMYFQAFDSLLEFVDVGFSSLVLSSIVHAVVVFVSVMLLAYWLRRHDLGLAVLCGAGAHVVSFSSMHAAANMQNHWVGISYTWGMCIFGLLVLGLGLALAGYLTYTAKRKAQLLQSGSLNNSFIEKTDDLENDVAAMSFSVAFTMFVRFVLSGHHPVGSEAEFDHTAQQRLLLLIYAVVCLLVAVVSVKFCSKKAAESDSYAVKRMMTFLNTVAAMNVAWAFLYWGEWEFFEYLYPGEAIKGRVMFAIIATIACGLLLIGLSKYPSTESDASMSGASITGKSDKMVALTALALVCAWSWELCFDAAMEAMTEGVAHPVAWKVATTVILSGIIVPVYAIYMRPITGPAAQAIGS